MSDTKTINALNNLLGDAVLSVHKFNGTWEVSLDDGTNHLVARRDSLREALNRVVGYMQESKS